MSLANHVVNIPYSDGSCGRTRYGLDGLGFEFRQRQEINSSPKRPDRLWGPSRLSSNGSLGPFPVVTRQGCEVDHSPPTAEVKNEWMYASAPPICLRGVDTDSSSAKIAAEGSVSVAWIVADLTTLYQPQSGMMSRYNHFS